jgi:1,6-anhydro-N-acetylmuramate kinase
MPWNWPRTSLHEIQAGGDPLSLDVLGVQHAKDGQNVELVHVNFAQNTVSEPLQMTILHHGNIPEPQDLKDNIETLKSEGPTSLRQVDALNKQIGNSTVKAIRQFAKQKHFSVDEDIDLIGTTGCFIEETTEDGA